MDEWNDRLSQLANSQSSISHQYLVTVPSSQGEESQDSCTEINARKSFPALYPEEVSVSEEQLDSEIVEVQMDPKDAAILVQDSEAESRAPGETSDDAQTDVHTVEETSVSEDNLNQRPAALNTSSSSSDVGEVTVIEKKGGGTPKESEALPMSQEDIFTEKDEGRAMQATPSEKVPSLQLSAEPMLVQETIEDEEIAPSPDAYGDVPLIIPSSPTQTPAETGEVCEFNPAGTSTLETGRSHRSRPQQSKPSQQSLDSEKKMEQGSQPPSENPRGQRAGPTSAEEALGNSQSLRLCLTESTSDSQQRSQPQEQVIHGSQRSSGVPAQSQGFAESQELHLYLTPSQESQPEPNLSGRVRPSAASQKERDQQPLQSQKSGLTSSSQSQSFTNPAGPSGRLGGSTSKGPAAPDLPLSESQSASETTFRLDRPDTSRFGLSRGEQSVEGQEKAAEMSVFARTRLGGSRHVRTAGALVSGEESAEFSMRKREESMDDSSDSLPCSQNRPLRHHKAEPERNRDGEEVKKNPAENVDVYGADTVMDSEPEEEEETQSYHVFPALSKSPAATASSVMEEEMAVDDIEVPVLPDTSLASLKPLRSSQPKGLQGQEVTPSGQPQAPSAPGSPHGSQSQGRSSQRQASQAQQASQQQQQASQQSQRGSAQQSQGSIPFQGTAAHQSERGESASSQRSVRASQRAVAASQERQGSNGEHIGQADQMNRSQQRQSQKSLSQESQQKKSQATRSMSSQRASQKKQKETSPTEHHADNERSPEYHVQHNPGPVHNPGPGNPSQAEEQDADSVVRRSQSTPPSRQLFQAEADPYLFHSSQSQARQEGGENVSRAENTSRAETSVSTMRMNTPRAMAEWKRKKLVKKKSEPNPRGEPEVTSPSADEKTHVTEVPPKPPKKGKKVGAGKFTKLQKGRGVFKKPELPNQKLQTVPETERTAPERLQQEPATVLAAGPSSGATSQASEVRPVPQAIPSTSRQSVTAGKPGSNQETLPMGLGRKRRSVEFADMVQMSSPVRSSAEPSLSDTQESDLMWEETHIREVVYRFVHRYVTVRKVDGGGKIVDEKKTEEKGDPVVMEENEITKKQRIFIPLSPSRSGSSLTSGDLADISSSLKTSSGPSSLEVERGTSFGSSAPERSLEMLGTFSHPGPVGAGINVAAGTASQSQGQGVGAGTSPVCSANTSQRRSEGASESAVAPPSGQSSILSPAVSTPNQSAIAHDESRHEAVVTSSSSGRNSDPLYSADNLPSGDMLCAQPSQHPRKSSSSSPDVVPPTVETRAQQGGESRTTTRTSSRSTKRMAADSSQEGRRDSKGASPAESQMFQPGNESGGFSVNLSPVKRKGSGTSSSDSANRTLRPQAETKMVIKSSGGSDGNSNGDQMSLQVPVQETSGAGVQASAVCVASKLVIGAKLMARWKDGFFYPATFRGLNTGIGNKFLVRFEDGFEKTVRAIDLILAQHLPLGQSVLVSGDDDLSDPGMVIGHVVEGDEVLYEVAMDNGNTRRCPRSKLLLTEDQASCLLSDEELRVSLGEKDGVQMNTADVSLDNVILGKRTRVKGSPAVALPSSLVKPSTSTAQSEDEEENGLESTPNTKRKQSKSSLSDSMQSPQTKGKSRRGSEKDTSTEKETSASKGSSRKRKMGPSATSTPTPKQRKTSTKQGTPVKRVSISPLGAAVSSPTTQKRPVRRARSGLFEQSPKAKTPEKEDLFKGYTFVLTYVQKDSEYLEYERNMLKDPSLQSSTDDSTDEAGTALEPSPVPFDKDQLTMLIESRGGTILSKFPRKVEGLKNFFVLSNTYHRTVKYFQALAANVPTVSHRWIIDSCQQNKLLNYEAYILPAGISHETHKIMERTKVTCLRSYKILLTSSNSEYLTAWTSTLEMAQCKVLNKLPSNATKKNPGVNVMVTDADCVPSILKKARQLDIPAVNSDWIAQALINNKLMDFDNPAYEPGASKADGEGESSTK